MKKSNVLALVGAGLVGALIATAVFPSAALANRAVTYLTSTNSNVVHLVFSPLSDGSWVADVCGTVQDSLGNTTPARCYHKTFAAGSGAATQLNTFSAGQALPFFQTSFDADTQ